MKKKLMYESPDVEVIEVKLVQAIASSFGDNSVKEAEEDDWGNI
jgi:hypothetical protein